MFSHRVKGAIIAFLFLLVFLIATSPEPSIVPQPTKTVTFVVSGWDYPDEYGQGIYGYFPKENSTGVFLNIVEFVYPSQSTTHRLNYTPNTALKFDVRPVVNYTFLGLTHPDDFDLGRNYIRLSIEMFVSGESVFFQQNLTYDDYGSQILGTDTWFYSYVVVVNVILQSGDVYAINIEYEIFW